MNATPPRSFTEPIIFHKVSRLYRIAHERVSRFPKVSRHSLGARIETTVLDLLESLYLAQSKGGLSRALILNKTDVQLKILFAHLRLAHATKCLNDAAYAELSEVCVEIGKMIGGWLKATQARGDTP